MFTLTSNYTMLLNHESLRLMYYCISYAHVVLSFHVLQSLYIQYTCLHLKKLYYSFLKLFNHQYLLGNSFRGLKFMILLIHRFECQQNISLL